MCKVKSSRVVACFVLASLVALAGCRVRTTKTTTVVTATPPSADEVWQRMVAAYRSAASYRDAGKVTLSYKQAGRDVEDTADMAVTYARPNKLRLRAYHVELATDGDRLRAKVYDEGTNHVDGQVVVRPAPERPSIEDLVSDPLVREMMSNAVVTSFIGRVPPQLELLLTENPFTGAAEKAPRKLLADEAIGDHPCYRLELSTKQGAFVLWIDRTSSVLRRIAFPREALLAELTAAQDVTDVQLVAEFNGAEIGVSITDSSFDLEIPAAAKQVRYFVPPPRPLPSELFGKPAGDFALLNPEGDKVTRDTLAGKVAVLVWFNDDPACETGLRQLELVYEQLKDDERYSFWAVCTEPSTNSHAQLSKLLKRWQVSVPLVRDLEAHGRDVFQIEAAPTLLVLDAGGIVQVVEVGANPQLAQELPAVLDKLARGESVSEIILADAERDRKQYARQLAIASSSAAGSSAVLEIPTTPIKEQSEPKQLTVTRLWSNEDLTAPGNLLVYERDGESRVLVVTGGRGVAELDREGRVVEQHNLELPEDVKISFLRTNVDKSGQRFFAASALFGQRALVFDQDWRQLASYPPADQPHEGIRDVQLVDLDRDGEVEMYVGFWGAAGVHRVSLSGERAWTNRSIPAMLSLAISAPDQNGWQKLLVTNEAGSILPINDLGVADKPVEVSSWGINHLIGNRFPQDRKPTWCGLAYTSEGNIVAVALDQALTEQWNYPLPPGLPRTQIEFVTSGDLLDDVGQWVFAAADGSVHIVSADGEFSDYFNYGETLTGIVATRFGDLSVLLVATSTGVSAWQVERRPTPNE